MFNSLLVISSRPIKLKSRPFQPSSAIPITQYPESSDKFKFPADSILKQVRSCAQSDRLRLSLVMTWSCCVIL